MMNLRKAALAAIFVMAFLTCGMAFAQETDTAPAPAAPAPKAPAVDNSLDGRSGYFSLGGGAGFTVSPDMTVGMINLDYYVTDYISVGPYFQIGGAGNNKFYGLSGQVKFSAPLENNPDIRPYGTIGIGFINMDFDETDKKDTTYLFPVGMGFEWALTDLISLDTGTYFYLTEDIFAGLQVGVRVLL